MGNLIFVILIFIFFFRSATEGGKKSSKSARNSSIQTGGIGKAADELHRSTSFGGLGGMMDEILRGTPSGAEMGRTKKYAQAKPGVRTEKTTRRPLSGKQIEAEQKRRNAAERSYSERRWAEARRKQEDALFVHSAGVDSCEGRLESLKVLYDAGILDREEYRERVARVREQHTHR